MSQSANDSPESWPNKVALMTARVLTGSKQEIARALAGIAGEIREVIVFVDEPVAGDAPAPAAPATAADLFAEMGPYTVAVSEYADSREAVYQRLGDE
jgi:hypothetical protein